AERTYSLLSARLRSRWASLFVNCGIGGMARFDTALSGDSQQPMKYALAEVAVSEFNPFRQEYLALSFLHQLLEKESSFDGSFTPWGISVEAKWVTLLPDSPRFIEPEFSLQSNIVPGEGSSFYDVPDWLPQNEQWRYRVGQVLRSTVIG